MWQYGGYQCDWFYIYICFYILHHHWFNCKLIVVNGFNPALVLL